MKYSKSKRTVFSFDLPGHVSDDNNKLLQFTSFLLMIHQNQVNQELVELLYCQVSHFDTTSLCIRHNEDAANGNYSSMVESLKL